MCHYFIISTPYFFLFIDFIFASIPFISIMFEKGKWERLMEKYYFKIKKGAMMSKI